MSDDHGDDVLIGSGDAVEDPKRAFDILVNALCIVGSPVAVQKKLPGTNVAEDVSLAFEDAFAQADFLVASKLVSQPQLKALEALDKHLESMSTAMNAALWTADAMGTQPEWARARELAVQALKALGRDLHNPDFGMLSM